jgi:hypothetical protein
MSCQENKFSKVFCIFLFFLKNIKNVKKIFFLSSLSCLTRHVASHFTKSAAKLAQDAKLAVPTYSALKSAAKVNW